MMQSAYHVKVFHKEAPMKIARRPPEELVMVGMDHFVGDDPH